MLPKIGPLILSVGCVTNDCALCYAWVLGTLYLALSGRAVYVHGFKLDWCVLHAMLLSHFLEYSLKSFFVYRGVHLGLQLQHLEDLMGVIDINAVSDRKAMPR